jgi:hypothetical protein
MAARRVNGVPSRQWRDFVRRRSSATPSGMLMTQAVPPRLRTRLSSRHPSSRTRLFLVSTLQCRRIGFMQVFASARRGDRPVTAQAVSCVTFPVELFLTRRFSSIA